jgi:hypothetical protein
MVQIAVFRKGCAIPPLGGLQPKATVFSEFDGDRNRGRLRSCTTSAARLANSYHERQKGNAANERMLPGLRALDDSIGIDRADS